MKQVKVTYQAFSDIPNRPAKSKTCFGFMWSDNLDTATDLQICEIVFEATNIQHGALWNYFIDKDLLPKNRTHTSLSVGDEVAINGRRYVCESLGFEEVITEDSKNESYYFDHADGRFI